MKKGFTLVELLIVIAIMGVLVTVTVSQFQTASRKARDGARKGDLNSVSKALLMYYTDYGKVPAASADGKIMVGGSPLDWGTEFVDGSYTYMKVLPKENNSSLPTYCYKTDVDLKKFAIMAMLENTADAECSGHTYSCGNAGKTYCFAYVSPNTSLDTNGNIQ